MSRLMDAVKSTGWETRLSVVLISLAAFIPALNSALADAPKVRAMLPNLGLAAIWPYVPAILVSIAAAVWVWKTLWHWPRATPPKGQNFAVAAFVPPSLPQEELAFRIALKQFALTYPSKLQNLVGRVRREVMDKIKSFGDQDYSYALHHAIHFGWSAGPRSLPIVLELANAPTDQMDGEALQLEILHFFDDYKWEQTAIANLNMLAKVDLANLDSVTKWLVADKDCWAELEKLKTWPQVAMLKKVNEGQLALTKANWTTPVRVNF